MISLKYHLIPKIRIPLKLLFNNKINVGIKQPKFNDIESESNQILKLKRTFPLIHIALNPTKFRLN